MGLAARSTTLDCRADPSSVRSHLLMWPVPFREDQYFRAGIHTIRLDAYNLHTCLCTCIYWLCTCLYTCLYTCLCTGIHRRESPPFEAGQHYLFHATGVFADMCEHLHIFGYVLRHVCYSLPANRTFFVQQHGVLAAQVEYLSPVTSKV